jgi:hypothetical protein
MQPTDPDPYQPQPNYPPGQPPYPPQPPSGSYAGPPTQPYQQDRLQQQHADSYTEHYDQYYQKQPPMKRRGKTLVVGLVSLLALAGLASGGAFYTNQQTQPTPDKVFAAAIENSLTTQSVTQSYTQDKNTATLQYDLSRSNDPRVYAEAKLSVLGITIDAAQYASLQNSYLSLNEFGGTLKEPSLASYKSKWMQIRKDGEDVDGGFESIGLTLFMPEARSLLFGDWLFANLPADQRSALQSYIVDQKVYSYDSTKVSKETVDGAEAFVYNVSFDKGEWLEMNKKMAAIWKVDSQAIADDLEIAYDEDSKLKIYIDIKTKRIVKAVATNSSPASATSVYSAYNTTTLPQEPTPQVTLKALKPLLDEHGESLFRQ